MKSFVGFFKAFLSILSLLISFQAFADRMMGTGFLVTPDGYIVTNLHVVGNSKEILVRLKGGKILEAKLARADSNNDLAILKIEGTDYKPFIIKPSSEIKRGEKVYAFGFPQTQFQGIEPKLTDGIISSLSGFRDEPNEFQISNPIQHGNSGGPLFTEDGKVVGIVVSSLSTLEMVKATGAIPQNINYAIKSNYLLELLRSMDVTKLPSSSSGSFFGLGQKKFSDIVTDSEASLVLIQAKLESQQVAKKVVPPSNSQNEQPSSGSNGRLKSSPPQQAGQPLDSSNLSSLPLCSGADFRTWSNCVGTHQYPNGNTYTGEYLYGMRNGNGFLDIVNRACPTNNGCIGSKTHSRYRGQFKNDQINGYGSWVSDNGEKYVGLFSMNLPNGRGTLTDSSGTKTGIFKDGKYVGQ
jgi:hypothetical protein